MIGGGELGSCHSTSPWLQELEEHPRKSYEREVFAVCFWSVREIGAGWECCHIKKNHKLKVLEHLYLSAFI